MRIIAVAVSPKSLHVLIWNSKSNCNRDYQLALSVLSLVVL